MGRYSKLGKPDREINPFQFQKLLDHCALKLEYKAYIALTYWVGCRRTEPLALKKEDITVLENDLLIRNLPAFKHGHRAEVLTLSMELSGIPLIAELATITRKGRKLFPFSGATAYRVVVSAMGVYPHWLRYNRVTGIRRAIDGKNLSLDDAKSFTGIRSDRTMQGYGMTSNEGAARVSKILKNE